MDRRNGHDDNRELLLDLAQRLLTHHFPGDKKTDTARLLPGEIPTEFPATVPLPESHRLIGGFVLRGHVTVVLDTSMTAKELVGFYKARMKAEGWTEPEPWPYFGQGGFQHDMMQEMIGTVFCRDATSLSVHIGTSPADNTAQEVRLNYDTDPRMSFCAQQRRHMGGMPPNVIPALSAPPRSTQMPKGGSSQSDGHSETSAYLKSELDLLAVVAHYEDQLARSGWVTQVAGHNGPMAWRTYQVTDEEGEEWNGDFLAIALPKKEEYMLFIEATMEGADQHLFLGGGMTFSH